MHDSDEVSSFGGLLRRHRMAAGLTQEALAERSGVAKRTLQDLERDAARPRRETVRRLVATLAPPPDARAQFEAATSAPRGERERLGRSRTASLHRQRMPLRLTSFIGRERELAEVAHLLETCRLVTLTGPGGCGKTRLALEVADHAAEVYPDGISVVWLAAIADPNLVASTVAQALGVQEHAGEPLLETLAHRIGTSSMLLVFDNFEHLLSAGSMLAELLATCPRLTALVTSREVLRLSGEQIYPLAPLSLTGDTVLTSGQPSDAVATVTTSEAGRLFVDRARSVQPGFQLDAAAATAVAEICVRLDGLPLAIELAAARVRLLPPQTMAQRLERRLPLLTGGARDLPARQQTLRDTIAWSYDLLDERERSLFHRLSVFAGGWTLDAAEAVCTPGDLTLGTLDGLDSLVSKSLIGRTEQVDGEPRFRMLETIREYALERLEESGEVAVLRRQHAAWCLELAEEAEPNVISPEQIPWLHRLESEHDNLRAALTWSQTNEAPCFGLRLTGALRPFWHIHGYWTEGRRWLEQALTTAVDTPRLIEAKALNAAGHLACNQGDLERAAVLHQQALSLARPLGDSWSIAWSLGRVAIVRWKQGAYEDAAGLAEESLTLFRELGIAWYVGWALNALGCIMQDRGDLDRARALFEEALPLFRATGEVQGLGGQLSGLGDIAVAQGDFQRATALYEECLAVARRAGFKQRMVLVLHSLGHLAFTRRDHLAAVRYYREGLMICRETGDRQAIAASVEGLALLALSTEQTDSAHLTQRAVWILSAATALRLTLGSPLPPGDSVAYTRGLTVARALMGESPFASAWAEGQAMPLERAIAHALDETHPR